MLLMPDAVSARMDPFTDEPCSNHLRRVRAMDGKPRPRPALDRKRAEGT